MAGRLRMGQKESVSGNIMESVKRGQLTIWAAGDKGLSSRGMRENRRTGRPRRRFGDRR
jgi:hypothetical protein